MSSQKKILVHFTVFKATVFCFFFGSWFLWMMFWPEDTLGVWKCNAKLFIGKFSGDEDCIITWQTCRNVISFKDSFRFSGNTKSILVFDWFVIAPSDLFKVFPVYYHPITSILKSHWLRKSLSRTQNPWQRVDDTDAAKAIQLLSPRLRGRPTALSKTILTKLIAQPVQILIN